MTSAIVSKYHKETHELNSKSHFAPLWRIYVLKCMGSTQYSKPLETQQCKNYVYIFQLNFTSVVSVDATSNWDIQQNWILLFYKLHVTEESRVQCLHATYLTDKHLLWYLIRHREQVCVKFTVTSGRGESSISTQQIVQTKLTLGFNISLESSKSHESCSKRLFRTFNYFGQRNKY